MSEYGGDPGLIQPESKGHRVGAAGADREAGQEEAMLMRMLGARERAGLPALDGVEAMRDHLASGKGWADA